MARHDYGTPNDPLSAPSLSDWAASIAADLDAVDAADYVQSAGDTMTGPLTLPGSPEEPLQAATKKYVDDLRFLSGSASTPMEYRLESATLAAGDLWTDTGDPATAAKIIVHEVDREGYDRSTVYDAMQAGDWANIHDRGNADNAWRFDITGPAVQVGDTYEIPVVPYDQIGEALLDEQRVLFVWRATGEGSPTFDEIWAPPTEQTASPLVTAHDPATGSIELAGIPLGDTGWRDVSGLLINGWAAQGWARLRRAGATVHLDAYLNGSAATLPEAMPVPAGFRIHSLAAGTWLRATGHNSGDWRVTADTFAMYNDGDTATPPTLTTLIVTAAWSTVDAWPTTLPGAPAAGAGIQPVDGP